MKTTTINKTKVWATLAVLIALGLIQIAGTPVFNKWNKESSHCETMHPASGNWGKAFYDPIDGGSCWACEKGATRTMNSVKSSAACISYKSAQKVGDCGCTKKYGRGTITDAINGGTCWTCPSGSRRTVFAINSNKACESGTWPMVTFKKAIYKGKPGCDRGFKDPIYGGTCWTCPSGYRRTAFAVNSGKACEKTSRAKGYGSSNIGAPAILSPAEEYEMIQITEKTADQIDAYIKQVTSIADEFQANGITAELIQEHVEKNRFDIIASWMNVEAIAEMFNGLTPPEIIGTSEIHPSFYRPTGSGPEMDPYPLNSPDREAVIKTATIGAVVDASFVFGINGGGGISIRLAGSDDFGRQALGFVGGSRTLGLSAGADVSLEFGFWVDEFTELDGDYHAFTLGVSVYGGAAASLFWERTSDGGFGKFLGFSIVPQTGFSGEGEYAWGETVVVTSFP